MTYQERQIEIEKIKADNSGILSTPLISEGAISSTQINRMGKNEFSRWQKNTMLRMDLESTIKHLSKSDDQLADEQRHCEQKARESRLLQINSRIQLIEGLGRMSHLESGKLRKNYRLEMDELLKEKEVLI